MRLAPIQRMRYRIALLLSIIFTANLIISPSIAIREERNVDYVAITKSKRLAEVQLPLIHTERTYYISALSGNEILSDVELYLIVNRSLQNISNIIHRINQILSSAVGFCVMLFCFGYVIRKKRRHKSILSRYLGGHAPPEAAVAV